MTRFIQLTQGKVTIVDDADYDRVMQHTWCAERDRSDTWYAKRRLPNYSTKSQPLASFILDVEPGIIVDHIDGDTLNNTRINLRRATHAQNMHNSVKRRSMSSQYKGVCWHKHKKMWIAYANRKHLGYFVNERDAALAYDKAARELFGEFARCNFPLVEV